MSAIPDCDCYCFEKVQAINADLEAKLAASEAGAAALREALTGALDQLADTNPVRAFLSPALAPDAGKELLARLERAERPLIAFDTATGKIARADAAGIRAQALDDAAKVAKEFPYDRSATGEDVAAAIRALGAKT